MYCAFAAVSGGGGRRRMRKAKSCNTKPSREQCTLVHDRLYQKVDTPTMHVLHHFVIYISKKRREGWILKINE